MDTNPIFLQQPSQIGFAGDITHISLVFSTDFPSDIQAKTERVVTAVLLTFSPGLLYNVHL